MTEFVPARGGDIVESFDITPTWAGLLPLYLTAYADGTPDAQSAARTELERMSRLADAHVAAIRAPAPKVVSPQMKAFVLKAMQDAIDFLDGEADQRADAGSDMSDYAKEPRDAADALLSAFALLEANV